MAIRIPHRLSAGLCALTLSLSTSLSPAITHAEPAKLDALSSAAKEGNHSRVEQLLRQGANVSVTDAYGQTPLMYAVHTGNVHSAELLLAHGANPNIINQYQVTPLKLAWHKQDMQMSRLLLRYGANSTGFTSAEWRSLQQQLSVTSQAMGRAPAPLKPLTPPQAIPPGPNDERAASAGAGSGSGWLMPTLIVGGIGAAVAGIAIAASDGDDDGESGTFDPSDLPIDTGGGDSGGDSGDSGDDNTGGGDTSTYETQEYNDQSGLAQINASSAYAAGYAGSGAIVAIIDTGVDLNHPELSDNLISSGSDVFDFGTASPKGQGFYRSHGTSVAGVIAAAKDGTGMHGVAYNAGILPIRAGDSEGTIGDIFDTVIPDAVNYAIAQGANIINASFGSPVTITDPIISTTYVESFMPNELNAYIDAVNAGIIHVYAAGNESESQVNLESGLPYLYPELQSHWLTVVSVDADNIISSFSNQCGVAQYWCLAAPGENIYTTVDRQDLQDTARNGNYTTVSGTSFAAPHVAGAAAVLMEAFPSLTTAQVVQILLTTATDLGAVGVDSTYGYGLVNLNAAMQPQGTITVATGNHVDGPQAELARSSVQLAPAFGDALKQGNAELMILDGYQRPYRMPLQETTISKGSLLDRDRAFFQFGEARFAHHTEIGNVLRFAYDPAEKQRFYENGNRDRVQGRFAMTARLGSHEVQMHHGVRGSEAFGFQQSALNGQRTMLSDHALANPFLGLMESGSSLSDRISVSDRFSIQFGAFNGIMDGHTEDDPLETGGAVAALRYRPHSDVTLSLQTGSLHESESFLGSETGGAMALDGGTRTLFAGIHGQWRIYPKLSLQGSITQGRSEINTATHSLIHDISDIRSDSYSLGILLHDAFADGHRAGLTVSQPLRVQSGTASFLLPAARDLDGSITHLSYQADMTPSGRELDLEGFYALPLGNTGEHMGSMAVGGMLRFEPDHRADADTEGLMMVKYQTAF